MKRVGRTHEELVQKGIAEAFGNGIAGSIVLGAYCYLDGIAEYNVEPITEFQSMCRCPQCGWFSTHFIEHVSNSYITRKCNSAECDRKWKQER